MDREVHHTKANRFLALHTADQLLVLPNIWDTLGARIVEAKGFPAVATTSAAISSSLGYRDGEKIRRSTLFDIIERITKSVDIPVTVDIESGYGDSIPELKETIHQMIAAGVAGINIEDSKETEGHLRPMDEQAERIAAVKEVACEESIPLVLNARVDCFLSGAYQTFEEKLDDCVARANTYTRAGADCVYPIGPGDRKTVTALRERIAAPINILATPDAEPLAVLQELGVSRVTFGPYIFRSCLKKFVEIADRLFDSGEFHWFLSDMMSRDEAAAFLMQESEQQ